MIKVKKAMLRDVPTLSILEIKCQDYAIPLDMIRDYVEQPFSSAIMASIGTRKVGYALYQAVLDDSESKIPYTVITRIGVHPEFRNMKVSTALMFEIEKHAWKQSHRCLKIYIPSYRCDDIRDPEYIVPWMDKFHFKVSKCMSEMFYHYGKRWDAYVFERPL